MYTYNSELNFWNIECREYGAFIDCRDLLPLVIPPFVCLYFVFCCHLYILLCPDNILCVETGRRQKS